MKTITKNNFREIESKYMMASAYYNKQREIIISKSIDFESKELIVKNIKTSIELLKTSREKIYEIEYKGSDFTVHSLPRIYHKLDEFVDDLLNILKKVTCEHDETDYSEYFKEIEEFEKDS